MEAAARTGMDLRIACPPEHRPLGEIAAATEALAETHGGRIRIGDGQWSARSFDGVRVIEAGGRVTVVRISGVTALVLAEN